MNENEIREIVGRVLSRYAETQGGPSEPTCSGEGRDIPLEVSARHVHLNQKAVAKLFGPGAALTPKRMLSQPGEFLSEQRVKLVSQKGSIENVAVLGPERSAVQCELSKTDCRQLSIEAPVNLSGDLSGAGDVLIIGPAGALAAKGSVIVAKAHVHLPPAEAAVRGISNGDRVRVSIPSGRPVTLDDVVVRVEESYRPAVHIDFDEANACACGDGVTVRIVK